jgi:hypothetical protein
VQQSRSVTKLEKKLSVVATKKEAKPIEIKINNEKPLKDFTLTLKTDEWAANAQNRSFVLC